MEAKRKVRRRPARLRRVGGKAARGGSGGGGKAAPAPAPAKEDSPPRPVSRDQGRKRKGYSNQGEKPLPKRVVAGRGGAKEVQYFCRQGGHYAVLEAFREEPRPGYYARPCNTCRMRKRAAYLARKGRATKLLKSLEGVAVPPPPPPLDTRAHVVDAPAAPPAQTSPMMLKAVAAAMRAASALLDGSDSDSDSGSGA